MGSEPSSDVWRVAVDVTRDAVAAHARALASVCSSVSWFGEGQGLWRVEGFSEERPDCPSLGVALAIAAAASGCELAEPVVETVEPTDWAAHAVQDFPAFRIGRLFLRGSHSHERARAGETELVIDAATAFGSGRHASTAGCLKALSDLVPRRRLVRALDMGCGSGILAIAIAKLWRARVLAADVDPEAARVSRHNASRNGEPRLVRSVCSDGYRSPAVVSNAPYDLIVANILARPLITMARDLRRHLAPNGLAILSGFLSVDANAVLAAHRAQELRLIRRLSEGDWVTLVLAGPGPRPAWATC